MKKKFLRLFFLIFVHGLFFTSAQSAVSISNTDNLNVGGYMIYGAGNDPTMSAATPNRIACGDAIKRFVKDTAPVYSRNSLSMTTTGTGAASYTPATGVFNIPTYSLYVPTIYDSVIRTVNVPFVVSSKEAYLCYEVKITIAVSVSLGAASSGRLTPYHKAPGGAYWKAMPYVENAPTLTGLGILSVGLLQGNTYQFNCYIPPGDSVLFSTSAAGAVGNVTFNLLYGQDRY